MTLDGLRFNPVRNCSHACLGNADCESYDHGDLHQRRGERSGLGVFTDAGLMMFAHVCESVWTFGDIRMCQDFKYVHISYNITMYHHISIYSAYIHDMQQGHARTI